MAEQQSILNGVANRAAGIMAGGAQPTPAILQVILAIITSLLQAAPGCGLNPALAQRRFQRMGPLERRAVRNSVKFHEPNPANWAHMESAICQVGTSGFVDVPMMTAAMAEVQ